MATFTIELHKVLELEHGDIGLEEYPIFDEAYRGHLNKKIIDHYLNREIGQETVSMFKLALRRKMNEIMPLYNQHYVLGLLKADPLSTVDLHTITSSDVTGTATGTGTSTSTSNAKGRTVTSDTPQTRLSGSEDYATGATDSVSETDGSGTTENTNTSADHVAGDSHLTGFQGHAPALVLAARQALVNVDMMIIDELEELFMLVWSSGDEFTRERWPYSVY